MSAINAYGNHVLKSGNGASPEVFTAIAGIRDADGTKTEAKYNDTSTFSTVGGYTDYTPAGLKDAGTIDLVIYFDPNDSTYEQLEADHDAQTLRNYRQELLTGSEKKTRAFAAYVASISERFEVNGVFEARVSLKLSGAIDRDAA